MTNYRQMQLEALDFTNKPILLGNEIFLGFKTGFSLVYLLYLPHQVAAVSSLS